VAESEARLRTFAESSRCIEVRVLWCALGGPVLQLWVFIPRGRFDQHKAAPLTPSYIVPCLHKISISDKWAILMLGRINLFSYFLFCLLFCDIVSNLEVYCVDWWMMNLNELRRNLWWPNFCIVLIFGCRDGGLPWNTSVTNWWPNHNIVQAVCQIHTSNKKNSPYYQILG
jgi:hypothetical protein